jgi:hypothetical protein
MQSQQFAINEFRLTERGLGQPGKTQVAFPELTFEEIYIG